MAKIKSLRIIRPKQNPDVDLDIGEYRGKSKNDIIKYLEDRYFGNVAHVGNINFYSLKSAIRDICTVREIPAQEKFACSNEINNDITLEENIKRSKTVNDFFKKYPELLDEVELLVGAVSSTSVHAGGIIIGDSRFPLKRYCGLQRSEGNNTLATIWPKDDIAQLGYVKIDLLGLSAASKLHEIRMLVGQDPYSDEEGVDDPEVFRNIAIAAKNTNIFQFESGLGKKALLELLPMNIEELSNASGIIRIVKSEQGRILYENYKTAVEQVQGGDSDSWQEKLRSEIRNDFNFECVRDILKTTYGVLIYQEQLAEMSAKLSKGKKTFTDGNLFRKALDKFGDKYNKTDPNSMQGDVDWLKNWHTDFIKIIKEPILDYLEEDGYKSKSKVVQDFLHFRLNDKGELPIPKHGILGMIITASAYIFSRLHAVAYSHISYWFMYHKYYNPIEFWLAALIVDGTNSDDVVTYINAMKMESGLDVLPPDINKSDAIFNVDKDLGLIRFGLSSIKNVGDKALETIINTRKKGSFKDIADFVSRIDGRTVNKRVVENLIFAGCFDFYNTNRLVVFSEFARLRDEENNYPNTNKFLSEKEQEILGLNIVHLNPIQKKIFDCIPFEELEESSERQKVAIEIVEVCDKVTKANKPYIMYKVRCLKSGAKFNIFDWNMLNIGKEKDLKIVRILKRNNFIQL